MAKSSQDLHLAAARYVLGELPSEALARIADSLLDEGVYSPEIGELATTRYPVMADAGPLFEAALRDLNVKVPSHDEAVWVLLRHHISRIASEKVPPRDGLRSVLEIYRRADLHAQSQTYVGDSHGIQDLIGAYWEYEDPQPRLAGASLQDDPEELRALDEAVVHAATVWVGQYGA